MSGIQKKYGDAEKRSYVEEFKKSGQSMNGFANKKGIPISTFRQWAVRRGNLVPENKDLTFGKIEINDVADAQAIESNANTITFVCDNIRIELQKNFNKEMLRKIVEVLTYA